MATPTEADFPLMADFLEVLPSVQEHLLEAGVEVDENDFELTYSRMAKNGEHSAVAATIETEIYNYFDSLRLPPTPTLYDHLMLALRKKHVIATFNWDPLLLQAARRCSFRVSSSHVFFFSMATYYPDSVLLIL